VKNLKIGDSLHVRDIVLPEGVRLVTDINALVIACQKPMIVAATEEVAVTEEPTTPEVITERKPKEGEEETEEEKK
jgi:large subunit ribosomal protein L25